MIKEIIFKNVLITYDEDIGQSPPHLGLVEWLNRLPPTPILGALTPRAPWPPVPRSLSPPPNIESNPVNYEWMAERIQSEFMFTALGLF